MKIELQFCDLDEMSLGLTMNYGEDQYGEFHMTTFGFIIFEINLLKYNA